MKLSRSLEISIQSGSEFALVNKHQILTVDHLMLGALNTAEVQGLFKACNISVDKLEKMARDLKESILSGQESVPEAFSAAATMIPSRALQVLLSESHEYASQQNKESVSIWIVL